jgi:hypothetical protein
MRTVKVKVPDYYPVYPAMPYFATYPYPYYYPAYGYYVWTW